MEQVLALCLCPSCHLSARCHLLLPHLLPGGHGLPPLDTPPCLCSALGPALWSWEGLCPLWQDLVQLDDRDASRTFTRHEVNTSRRSPLRLWQCGTAAVASSKVGQRNWKESKMKTQLLMQVDCVAITNSRKDNRLQREGNEITLFVYLGG